MLAALIDPDWNAAARQCSCNQPGVATHPLRHEGFCRPRWWQRRARWTMRTVARLVRR